MTNPSNPSYYVVATDTTTGMIREESEVFVSREDAEDHAQELRAKWTLATKVTVRERG